ncbi:SARP family transcriptional regulator [Lentzea sp. NBRC 105346]|uniref:AfsR/SARP family transcriptional regulator n=1 Tax=Lentzea sp. NBRC 105346 TaxID=3032205 RepID=UPI0024A108D3|nr:BTAD domain-containing putative transcriptional regulator [Lentzea sp. NBRC 105346]GLZ33719.1 SARP family transcriptional regulator [Lentzea sp. NBRC 105346]
MEFRLLGPVEAYADDGSRLPVGPPKQRAVLALLLAQAGQVLSVDRLISVLWDDAPPKTALKNLQVYVYQLRKIVGSRLLSRPPGYLMSVRPEELDLVRFTELLDVARRERTPERYRAALSLWRGPALADLAASGLLRGVVAQLDELRLAARVECADAELDRGRHVEIIAELNGWVREHPLHERLREQQMIALHRSGRSAEALAAYQECRTLLDDELGVEPGTGLKRLHAAILRAKPVAGEPVRQLPPDVASFAGRTAELASLREQLARTGRVAVCVITGQAGIGKSALAVRMAHSVARDYPDGQLYADLAEGNPIDRFLRALGVTDVPVDRVEAAAQLRSLTAERRLLVVLDNVASAGQVRRLLPTGPGSAVLVTSRRPLADLAGASYLRLGALPMKEALRLLNGVAGRERVQADRTAATQLVRWCGGLPLALRIIGARLVARPQWTLQALADRLADERRRLDELKLGDLAVRTAFAVSYAELGSSLAARTFRLLGLVDGPDLAVTSAVALADDPDVEDALAELADACLVEEPEPGRYHLHDLLRLFARERCRAEESRVDRTKALRRLHEHLLTALNNGPDDTWLEAERLNLLAAVRQAEPATAIAFAHALSWYFRRRSEVVEWEAINDIALAAARETGDQRAEALALKELGAACERALRVDDAMTHWTAALELSRELGDRALEAFMLNNIGIVHWRRRDLAAARECLESSLALRVELDDEPGAAKALTNLGLVHAAAGDHTAALECYERTSRTFRQVGDRSGELFALANIAQAQRELGEEDLALASVTAALDLARELGDRQTEAGLLLDLGGVHELADRAPDARDAYRAALELCRMIGFQWGEEEALRRLAMG